MTRQAKHPPLERLIRRCLNNGIKTLSGQDNRVNPTLGAAKLLTYDGDRTMFLAILQADAAQIDHTYDQGARAAEFAVLVAEIHAKMATEKE